MKQRPVPDYEETKMWLSTKDERIDLSEQAYQFLRTHLRHIINNDPNEQGGYPHEFFMQIGLDDMTMYPMYQTELAMGINQYVQRVAWDSLPESCHEVLNMQNEYMPMDDMNEDGQGQGQGQNQDSTGGRDDEHENKDDDHYERGGYGDSMGPGGPPANFHGAEVAMNYYMVMSWEMEQMENQDG